MDRPALIQILDDFVDAHDGWREAEQNKNWVVAGDHYSHMIEWYPLVVTIAERLASRVVSGAMGSVPETTDNSEWWRARNIALATRGIIERGAELEEALGPAADVPHLPADELHPNVWGPAKAYWEAELYGDGVEAAAKALAAIIRHKAERPELDGVPLINETLSPLKPGKRRLVVRARETGPTVDSIRQGVHALGLACYQALRNPLAHTTDALDEQIALEQLATLSLLARFVDEAILIERENDA